MASGNGKIEVGVGAGLWVFLSVVIDNPLIAICLADVGYNGNGALFPRRWHLRWINSALFVMPTRY